MAKGESYNDLIFALGDLARERLARKPNAPRSMDRVLRAEQVVLQRRDERDALEAQMNEADAAHKDFEAQAEEDRRADEELVKKWKKAVDAIDGRVKGFRKKLLGLRSDSRYAAAAMKTMEAKHAELEMTAGYDLKRLATSKDNIKKLRIANMRRAREIEELERELQQLLTPDDGTPGAPGIIAHRRILEREDELERRKVELDEHLAELDALVAKKEEEVRAAEDYLDQAVFLLGEECYSQRLPDPALAALYPRIDKVAG